MEKLKIDNFLGLNNIDLDMNEFNILIGPQASGKSIIAKLLHFSKSVFEEIQTFVIRDETLPALKKNLRIRFIDTFHNASWKDDSFVIEYFLNDYHLSISNKTVKNKSFTIEFINGYTNLWENVKKEKKKIIDEVGVANNAITLGSDQLVESVLRNRIKESYSDVLNFTQLYIPAGRSFFSLLQSSIFSVLSTNTKIDPLLRQFGSFYERLKLTKIEAIKKNLPAEFNKLSEDILLGDFVNEKGKDYIIRNNGRKLDLSYCSSGQQEVLPLILTLITLSVKDFIQDGLTVYIEEPEAHIFPLAQKKIMEMFIQVFNKANKKIQFFITTHSPYVLTSANNFLLAGLINRDSKRTDKLLTIINKESILDPSVISAYSIENGKLESIIDEESDIILGDLIDNVSNVLGDQYVELLDLVDYEN